MIKVLGKEVKLPTQLVDHSGRPIITHNVPENVAMEESRKFIGNIMSIRSGMVAGKFVPSNVLNGLADAIGLVCFGTDVGCSVVKANEVQMRTFDELASILFVQVLRDEGPMPVADLNKVLDNLQSSNQN